MAAPSTADPAVTNPNPVTLTYPPSIDGVNPFISLTCYNYKNQFAIKTKADMLGTLALPLPMGMSNNHSIDYQGIDLQGMAAAGVQGYEGYRAVLDAVGASAIASFKEYIGDAGRKLSALSGKTINPLTELSFEQPNLRSFSLTYDFIAKSAAETQILTDLIKFIRKNMHASKLKGSELGLLNFPAVWQIEVLPTDLTQYYFKSPRCFLQSFDYQWNRDGAPSFYYDTGAPVQVSLTMQFGESQLITQEDLEAGVFI